ncbi:hypothetical protein EAB87_14555, partial [Enterococcus faecalis]|nr:hypothetical protein [Enterococcus faecalis]
MVKTRYVRFDFFSPIITKFRYKEDPKNSKKKVKEILSEEKFDFIDWMTRLSKMSVADKEISYKQETIRTDKIYVDPKTDYGIVHYTRLRETNIPALTQTLVEELQDIGLKKDEYIAEDVSSLYDHELNVLMVQRNIHCLSPSGIEYYINNFLEDENSYVELRPIVYKHAFKRGKGKQIYRSLDIKTANCPAISSVTSMSNPISKAFQELEELDGCDVEIIVKTPRGKKEKLNKKRIENILEDFEKEAKYLEKAEVGFKESEEASIEKIDLLKGKIYAFLPFSVQPRKFLNPNVVQTDMINNYHKKDG